MPKTPSAPPSHFGDRLRVLREEAGWTQAALANKIGVPVMTISKYERCVHEPNWAVVLLIADSLKVNVDQFRIAKKAKAG